MSINEDDNISGEKLNFDLQIEDRNDSAFQKNKKKALLKKVLIIGLSLIVLTIIILLLISIFSYPKELQIKKPEEGENLDVSPFVKYFNSKANIRFPFTIKLSVSDDQIKPDWIFSPFEEVDYTTVKDNSYEFSNTISKTNSERNFNIGLDLSLSGAAELFGGSLKLDKFAIEFETYKIKKTFKEAVWLKVQNERVIIDRSKLTLTESYINEIDEILNSELENEKKLQRLIKIFDNKGYYVPTEIGMGGKFSFIFEENTEIDAEKIAGEIKADLAEIVQPGINATYNKNITAYSSNLKLRYFGGENILAIGAENMGQIVDWFESIDEENALPVDYYVIEPIHTFLPSELRKKYILFEDTIEQRYKVFYEKYKIFAEAVDKYINLKQIETEKTEYYFGIMSEYSSYIKTIQIKIDESNWTFTRKELNFHKSVSSNEKIVGFKIIQHRNSWVAGWFQILENPIVSSELNILLTSGWNCDVEMTIEIYYIKWDDAL